jgi:hypothetical protein
MPLQMKIYSKIIIGCSQCPYFWDEGEFCTHPYWDRKHRVIYDFPHPEWCPLPDYKNLKIED